MTIWSLPSAFQKWLAALSSLLRSMMSNSGAVGGGHRVPGPRFHR